MRTACCGGQHSASLCSIYQDDGVDYACRYNREEDQTDEEAETAEMSETSFDLMLLPSRTVGLDIRIFPTPEKVVSAENPGRRCAACGELLGYYMCDSTSRRTVVIYI